MAIITKMFTHRTRPTAVAAHRAGGQTQKKRYLIPMNDQTSGIRDQKSIADGILVYLEGDVVFARSPVLRAQLIELLDRDKPQRLIIDLTDVAYMDSSGIATIVETLQHQRQHGRKLVLCSLQQRVYSMFEIANLDSLFTIADDEDAAQQI